MMLKKVTAIDVGSSKISCLVVRHNFEKEFRILGSSRTQSAGISKGIIRNLSLLEKSILFAIETIEKRIKDNISHISINLSGVDLHYTLAEVSANLSQKPISKKDLKKLLGIVDPGVPNARILHIIPIAYTIDNIDGIKDPIGMVGNTLSLKATIVYTNKSLYKNLLLAFERCNIKVDKVIADPYAVGLGVLTEDEAKIGTVLIDIGATLTSITFFKDSAMLFLKSLPIGGGNITKDIAYAFDIDFKSAERLKILYGSATRYTSNAKEFVLVPAADNNNLVNLKQVQKSEIFAVIEPRVREIFDLILKEIKPLKPRNIVITGGTSMLTGLTELAENIFRIKVRHHKITDEYSPSAIGIINSVYTEVLTPSNNEQKLASFCGKNTVINKVVNWIIDNF